MSVYSLDELAELTAFDAWKVKEVIVPNSGLTSLTMMKRFPNIKVLNVRGCKLTHLYDIPLTLTMLYYDGNPLNPIWNRKSTSEIVRMAAERRLGIFLKLRRTIMAMRLIKKWSKRVRARLYHPDHPRTLSLYKKYNIK